MHRRSYDFEEDLSAQDVFVFPSTFPFEKMWKVVVGRWYVDSAILVYAHARSFDVVDITSLASIHQGFDSSLNHMGKVPRKDFYWNAAHINSHLGNTQGRITSNYFIRWVVLDIHSRNSRKSLEKWNQRWEQCVRLLFSKIKSNLFRELVKTKKGADNSAMLLELELTH